MIPKVDVGLEGKFTAVLMPKPLGHEVELGPGLYAVAGKEMTQAMVVEIWQLGLTAGIGERFSGCRSGYDGLVEIDVLPVLEFE